MEKQTIRFKDCGIYYERYLNPGKPYVVMLHSFGSSGLIFSDQIVVLKRQYQIIVVDFPGHGQSEYSKYVLLKDMPEIINMIFEIEKITKAHFIGISEGAEIAQAFAHLFPKKVSSLIGISTMSIYYDSHKALSSSLALTNFKLNFFRIFYFKKYKKWFIERSAHTLKGREKFKESMVGFKRKSKNVLKGFKRFYSLGENTNEYPSYIVCGEEDLDVIKDASVQYEQKIPLTTLEGYRQSKQIVFLDNNRLFNERMKIFLSEMEKIGE
ncbi:MAG TPA: alpha/beta hydrolase [Acholeplasma sp.]|jgi:3-oxoadipate enol-lactonase|nr:alpha/beta hydrolase [Acholeplasma sp.]